MMSFSLGDLNATDNYYEFNDTIDSHNHTEQLTPTEIGWIAFNCIILVACCIGLVGNGYIIWLLGFQMKRNCFTTFIFNLAISDFGYLASILMIFIYQSIYFLQNGIFLEICVYFLHMTYMNGNFLLTSISIDRCVAVLFPLWHRCSRPQYLSSRVCAFLWISSFLLGGILTIIKNFGNYRLLAICFFVSAIVCLPLITLSAVVLFIKVCLKSNQKNKGRLLLIILISLLCFLFLGFPLNVFLVIDIFSDTYDDKMQNWFVCSVLFSYLNSSINPVIYFLVGRKKGSQSKESMKVLLQKVFKEGEVTRGR